MKDEVEESIDLIESGLVDKIKALARSGMSAFLIATAVGLPIAAIETVLAAPSHTRVIDTEHEQLIDALARTIYAEAQGEPYQGKLGVATVIYNRAGGDTAKMYGVMLKPKQFSSWNRGMPRRGKGPAWQECQKIARQMVDGTFKPTSKALHFYNPKYASPKWAAKRTVVARVGQHVFLDHRKYT